MSSESSISMVAIWLLPRPFIFILAMNAAVGRSFSTGIKLWQLSTSARSRIRQEQCCCFVDQGINRVGIGRIFRLFSSSSKGDANQITTAELKLLIPTAEDMEDVGGLVASVTLEDDQVAGSKIFLMGDLGAGKTAFSRGFLRTVTGDAELRVTSPTYLLSNSYLASAADGANKNLEIHHIDLYRLPGKSSQEFSPLNLDYVFARCIALIEWPIRLPEVLIPEERLDIDIRILAGNYSEDSIQDTESMEDNVPRIISLLPRSSVWSERLRIIRDEGYVDDLLVEA